MKISKMRHRLELQSPNIIMDKIAGNIKTWVTISNIWCEITTQSGQQSLSYEKLTSKMSYKVKTRYNDKIKPHMRFKLSKRIFFIKTVANEGEIKRYTICSCEEELDRN